MLPHSLLRATNIRFFSASSTARDLAKLLREKFPNIDPRSLKESRIVSLLPHATTAVSNHAEIHSEWKKIYEKSLHDSAFDEMADPGELCDGELPSWTRDRLRAENDKDYEAPTVSAHEAKTRLKFSK
jgi:hypothetical protein